MIGSTDRAAELARAIVSTPGVVSVAEAGQSHERRHPVLGRPRRCARLRRGVRNRLTRSAHSVRECRCRCALVGGSDAQALDARDAARRDQRVVIPAILLVVLVVLYVLLRAALAPLILVAVTVLSALAALGLGGWASVHVVRLPRAGQHHPAVRDPVPGRARRGLHDLPGHPRPGGDARARHPARHRACGLGHRRA